MHQIKYSKQVSSHCNQNKSKKILPPSRIREIRNWLATFFKLFFFVILGRLMHYFMKKVTPISFQAQKVNTHLAIERIKSFYSKTQIQCARSHFIKINDSINIHVVEFNATETPSENQKIAYLLHGFPENWYSWRFLIPDLVEKGYRVLAPDQRGYNLSSKPSGKNAYGVDRIAQDSEFILKNTFGIDGLNDSKKIVLIGHDWGGVVAFHFAKKYPSLVKKLIVLNAPDLSIMQQLLKKSASQRYKSWYFMWYGYANSAVAFFSKASHYISKSMYKSDFKRGLTDLNSRGYFTVSIDELLQDDIEYYRKSWLLESADSLAIESMMHWYNASKLYNQSGIGHLDKLKNIDTTVIWGLKDLALDSQLVLDLQASCPSVKALFLPDLGHFLLVQHPYVVNRAILSCL